MPIYQVKYNQGHYAYYNANCMECVDYKTTLHHTYPDAKENINPLEPFESSKIRESLIKFFQNDNSRN